MLMTWFREKVSEYKGTEQERTASFFYILHLPAVDGLEFCDVICGSMSKPKTMDHCR